MAVIISAVAKRNDLYLSEVIGNNYIAMMRKTGEKSKIAAPTTYQKKVYRGPIGIIPSYVTAYNDYKSKAKESFRIFGRPFRQYQQVYIATQKMQLRKLLFRKPKNGLRITRYTIC